MGFLQRDYPGRLTALARLGLETSAKDPGARWGASGRIEGFEIEIRWQQGDADILDTTSVTVSAPGDFGPIGFSASRRGRIRKGIIGLVSRRRTIPGADGSVLAVSARDDQALDAWLTDARLEALRSTPATKIKGNRLLCLEERLLDDEDDVVGMIQDLIATARVLR